MPCSDHAILLKATAQHGRRETAVLCCCLNGMVGTWHGHGMATVNQTRPHCVIQMGKKHSKKLSGTAWQGKGMGAACEHVVCESVLSPNYKAVISFNADPSSRAI